mmetsp:Transcript_90748/g.171159  ORF Transcript_90748/g.171159 Transcript_90748/m.171159 type:complete len:240 (+) Transcript_90748:418-1137(+)
MRTVTVGAEHLKKKVFTYPAASIPVILISQISGGRLIHKTTLDEILKSDSLASFQQWEILNNLPAFASREQWRRSGTIVLKLRLAEPMHHPVDVFRRRLQPDQAHHVLYAAPVWLVIAIVTRLVPNEVLHTPHAQEAVRLAPAEKAEELLELYISASILIHLVPDAVKLHDLFSRATFLLEDRRSLLAPAVWHITTKDKETKAFACLFGPHFSLQCRGCRCRSGADASRTPNSLTLPPS